MEETIGQLLKKKREERGLTIAQVSTATRIRTPYIEAIEENDFTVFSSQAHARGFLRLYSGFLGLSLDELLSSQPVHTQEPEEVKPAEEVETQEVEFVEAEPEKSEEVPSEVETITMQPVEHEEPVMEEAQLESEVSPQPSESKTVFLSIGEQLRQRRDLLGLTLEEVERHTRVRSHYLEALEAGDLSQLPSSVQTRGLLSNYARFMDMDVEAILLRFAEGLQAQRIERQPSSVEKSKQLLPTISLPAINLFKDKLAKVKLPAVKLPTIKLPAIKIPPSLRRFLSTDLLFGAGIIIALLILAIWGATQIFGQDDSTAVAATAPSISDVLLASPQAVDTPQPTQLSVPATSIAGGNQTPVITIPTAQEGAVQVYMIVLARTWVRVTVDGKIVLEDRVLPGSAFPFDGQSTIEILAGNGAALEIVYNQSNLGVMGTSGESVNRIYTTSGILEPTPTTTPTPTNTPRTTPAPSATPTPTYTSTPTQ